MKFLSYIIVLSTLLISVVNAAPPGLYNNTPPGLQNHDKVPYGWTQGKKTGWDKDRHHHRHHHHEYAIHHDHDDIHH